MLEPTFRSNRVIVRPINKADFHNLTLGINDPSVNLYAINQTYCSDLDAATWYYNSYYMGYHWVIAQSCDCKTLIGCISLEFMNERQDLELGYWLLPEYRSKGYMTEALSIILSWIEKQYSDKIVFAEIANTNIPSYKIIERLGFTFLKESSYAKEDGSEIFPSRIYYRGRSII